MMVAEIIRYAFGGKLYESPDYIDFVFLATTSLAPAQNLLQR